MRIMASGLASNDAHKLLESFREHLSDPGDGWSLYFCGHSMGAAVANVVWLMMQLAGSGKGPFGAKASGLEWLRDRSFAICLASPMVFQKSEPVHEDDVPLLERMRCQCLTFVNGNDVVPRVPGHPSYAKTHLLGGDGPPRFHGIQREPSIGQISSGIDRTRRGRRADASAQDLAPARRGLAGHACWVCESHAHPPAPRPMCHTTGLPLTAAPTPMHLPPDDQPKPGRPRSWKRRRRSQRRECSHVARATAEGGPAPDAREHYRRSPLLATGAPQPRNRPYRPSWRCTTPNRGR